MCAHDVTGWASQPRANVYNRFSAVFLRWRCTAPLAHADVGRFSCLWGLRMAVKNRQNVKSEVGK